MTVLAYYALQFVLAFAIVAFVAWAVLTCIIDKDLRTVLGTLILVIIIVIILGNIINRGSPFNEVQKQISEQE